jgi:hypothetical protein
MGWDMRPSFTRRHAAAIFRILLLPLYPALAEAKKKDKKKKRKACKSGPCNYGKCLAYISSEGSEYYGGDAYDWFVGYADSKCCSALALSYTGEKYRSKVVSCVYGIINS